jgi:Zn-dependent protease/predicted transcriptional regulator
VQGRGSGIDLFRVAGVQIALDASWLIIFALILWSLAAGYFPHAYPGYGTGEYWLIGLAATLLFFASILAHELAHAVVGNRRGQEVRRITLFIFGGMAHLSREPDSPRDELVIAAVGPLTSVALAGVFWLGARWAGGAGAAPLWVAAFDYLAAINLALAVFNLLPGFPLDGGRLLRAVLWLRWRDLQAATARAADWGAGIGLGLIALGIFEVFGGVLVGGLWLVLIGMFLRGAAHTSYQSTVVEQALGQVPVRDLMIRDPVTVPAEATISQAVEEHFLRHGFASFPVRRNGEVEGLISLQQIKDCPPAERGRRTIHELMRPAQPAIEVPASAPAAEALRRMAEAGSGRLLVVEGGHVVGLITRAAIMGFVHVREELRR